VIDALERAENIVIATHSPMDGDGAGSGLALMRAWTAAGKTVRFVTEDPVPRAYRFLPGEDEIEVLAEQGPPVCDLLVGIDAGDGTRLGRALADLPDGIPVVNVDHHVSNTRFGDHNWVDPAAAAVGEQAYGLLVALGLKPDQDAALCLLVALMTDTGRFCYSNTTPRTLAIASELVRLGAEPDRITRHLYASVPRAVLELEARAIQSLEFRESGRISLLVLPENFGRDLGVDRDDVKDLVDIGISVEGVVATALVYGLPDGRTKVSLRSKDDRADVAAFASARGGGGHVRASGFTSESGPDETAEALRREMPGLLEAIP
jgi:phosphoesterase RecJ-like protein